jgi:glycosyltransferase involved in cell wall biosynthesis
VPSADHKLFSIVIPTFNEGERLHRTVDSILNDTTYAPIEVIVVDDGSTDGSCDRYQRGDERLRVIRTASVGIPRARNLGAGHARGEYVLFIDAHCTVSPDWIERFVAALRDPDVGIVGPAFTRLDETEPRGCGNIWINQKLECAWLEPLDTDRPYEVPITPGGCQAFRKKTFEEIGGFDAGFTRWGYQDEEICLRAWLLGYRVLVDPKVTVAHYFRTKAGYSVPDGDILLNFLRMIHLHLSPPRIRRCIAALGDYPGLEAAIDRLYEGDIFQKRAELLSARYRSDDWFFKVFMPSLA